MWAENIPLWVYFDDQILTCSYEYVLLIQEDIIKTWRSSQEPHLHHLSSWDLIPKVSSYPSFTHILWFKDVWGRLHARCSYDQITYILSYVYYLRTYKVYILKYEFYIFKSKSYIYITYTYIARINEYINIHINGILCWSNQEKEYFRTKRLHKITKIPLVTFWF